MAVITNGKEYAAKIILNLNQVRDMERAQRVMYDNGFVSYDHTKLMEGLGLASGVIGFFLSSSTAGISNGIFGLVTSLATSQMGALKNLVYEGYWQMGYLEDYLVDHPQYDLIEVNLPWIEYTVDGQRIRFVTGKGVVTRVHSGSGWITL